MSRGFAGNLQSVRTCSIEVLTRRVLLHVKTMKKLLITMKELHAKFSSDSAHQVCGTSMLMCLCVVLLFNR